jgi:hypothetical protein
MTSKRLLGAATMLAVVVPSVVVGCGDTINPVNDLCCTELKIGADLSGVDFGVDASIQGQFEVLAQGASDFSATAAAMLDDVTNGCRGIAQDLGADTAAQAAAEDQAGQNARARAWCKLAVAQLQASGAAAGTLDIEPPSVRCSASVDARARCEAKCSASGTCDVKANPPRCTGGTLMVECDGACTASADAPTFRCEGKCDAAVNGRCTAQGGVECAGRCDGTCAGETDAQGNCNGTCKGTCDAVAPQAKCDGTFDGDCQGTCEASPGTARAECSGECDVDARPLRCEGGTLEGGCQVDAKCDADCDASVQAKASCDVRPFAIRAKGSADAKIDAAIATLKVNLPKLLVAVKARGEAMGRIAAGFAGKGTVDLVSDPGKLGVKGAACGVAIVSVLGAAVENAKTSIDAGGAVTAQVGL